MPVVPLSLPGGARRGFALVMVVAVTAAWLILALFFSGSVTAEYRAAVYSRHAGRSEEYCLAGLHRAMAELAYDVWGVGEPRPFLSARYNPEATGPEDNLLELSGAAYYDSESGALRPVTRQRGFWNGEAWVVWAGGKVEAPAGFGNPWNMDPSPRTRPELPGGAQRYLSYGSSSGRVSCTRGRCEVRGDALTNFCTSWPADQEIRIAGVTCRIASVLDERNLMLAEPYDGPGGEGLGWSRPGEEECPASADRPPTFPGGPQPLAEFLATGRGWAADPRWVDPAKFIRVRPERFGEAWAYGGVDLDGDGRVTAADKALRDWALWQLRRDAFLPEGLDNHDLFQAQLHANDRRLAPNGRPVDHGWEFIDPKIVGDSFYLVFRSDPLYSLAPEVSGDPSWTAGAALDGGSAGRSDRAGFRYPYDRTHLGRWPEVAWADDPAGGLADINGCNNDWDTEDWTGPVPDGASPGELLRHPRREAKWIYCYHPSRPEERHGRYAVTVLPECSVWNASALHCGNVQIAGSGPESFSDCGALSAVSGLPGLVRAGHDPRSGEPAGGALLSAHSYSAAPIRPEPLPAYWTNVPTDGGSWYYCADRAGSPGLPQTGHYPAVDYTRAQEIVGAHTGKTRPTWQPYTGRGLRVPVFNYQIWLGPYASRAELATHLRKGCLAIFTPPYPSEPDHCGLTRDKRRRMEDRDTSPAAQERIAADARRLAALTGVHGYYYTLDRFWDRDLLVVEAGAGAAGSQDARLATTQSASDRAISFAAAAEKPAQRTRLRFIDALRNLECTGGYRTPDGGWRLADYLFDKEAAAFRPELPPDGCLRAPTYGGPGEVGRPETWKVQRRSSRIEKAIAGALSRTASMQRGGNALTAACPRGHLLHNPRVSSLHAPRWEAGRKIRSALRAGPDDPTLDDLAEGCPVCGGRLMLDHLHEVYIGEVGRFHGRFRTAERPAREARDLDDPGRFPARHFVELLVYGHRGRFAGLDGSEDLVRFDVAAWDGSAARPALPAAVLCDPLSLAPYFASRLDFDMRWRSLSTAPEAMDPEPVFRDLGRPGSDGGTRWDLRLLVWDGRDRGGRWHDVTHCAEAGAAPAEAPDGAPRGLADAELYAGSWRAVRDDSDPDSSRWPTLPLRCDERYAMPDPDPAHRQAAELGGFTAALSLYRKMPVRWHGGDRPQLYDLEYARRAAEGAPLGRWRDEWAARPGDEAAQPDHRWAGRGLGFAPTMRLAYAAHRDDGELWGYRGDWHSEVNPGGWPGPARRDGVVRRAPDDGPGADGLNPRQYAAVSFDAGFDGSRLALVRCSPAEARPNYTSWRLVDYVELCDSAGRPVRIGESCGRPDPLDPSRVLSWQCRNPLDNRSNADGYTSWDLLPMTLQNADHSGAADPFAGYDPWRVREGHWTGWQDRFGEGRSWWGNEDEAFFRRVNRVLNPSPVPGGYADLRAGVCGNRNANFWTVDVPGPRAEWDGRSASSGSSRPARAERMLAHLDNCTDGHWTREADRKECILSIPTGVGRQNLPAEAVGSFGANSGTGRQHLVLPTSAGYRWREGPGLPAPERRWAAYSWNSWADLCRVTDLCGLMLWDVGNTVEGRDFFDAAGDGERDGLVEAGLAYFWNGGEAAPPPGRYVGGLKQVNKLNLNEIRFAPALAGAGWEQSFSLLGRKPLKGFPSPSEAAVRQCTLPPGSDWNLRVRPWDLDGDFTLDADPSRPAEDRRRLEAGHCMTSPVHTVIVTGAALDEEGRPLAETRLRATVERTWDGRVNILEFNWLPADRGFSE